MGRFGSLRRDPRLFIALATTGAGALAMEVVWSQVLVPWVGGTAMAQVATVSMYMLGLFIGATLGAPLVARVQDPRSFFMRAELIAIVITAAAILAMPLANPLFALLSKGPLLTTAFGGALRGAVGGFLILPATILMGLAFPMVISAVDRTGAGREAAALAYGINTAGATAGTCIAGFFLLPRYGTITSALITLVGVLIVLAVAWRPPPTTPSAVAAQPAASGSDAQSRSTPFPWREDLPMFISVTVGGLVALGLEVVLFRVLGMILGPTARAFTVVLGTYVLGLGLGALLVRPIVRRGFTASRVLFAACWTFAGAVGLAVYWRLGNLAEPMAERFASGSITLRAILLEKGLAAAMILLPLTIAFGASYAAAVAAGRDASPSRAGGLYAALTVGNVLGLIVAAFWILPTWGLEKGLLTLAALAFLTPVPVLIRAGFSRPLALGWAGVLVVLAVLAPSLAGAWDWKKLNTAPYMYFRSQGTDQGSVFLYLKSGFETTVSVTKHRENRYLKLDGKTDGSTTLADMSTQSLTGVLPAILHHDPGDALVLGLGTGQTVTDMLRLSVDQVDCAEIIKAVIETLPLFDEINLGIEHDPRFNLYETDGRTMLRYGGRQYDVLVSEPSNVWVPGVAQLFTKEAFEEARRAVVSPDGVFCQWLQAYNLDPQTFRTVLRTLLSVFPHVSLWVTSLDNSDALLVATGEPLRIDPVQVARRLAAAEIPNHMGPRENLNAVSLLRNFVASTETLRRWAGEGSLNRDRDPSLAYEGEASLLNDAGQIQFHLWVSELTESPVPLLVNPGPELAATLERRTVANRSFHGLMSELGKEATLSATPTGLANPGLGRLRALAQEHEDDPELRWAVATAFARFGSAALAGGELQGAEQLFSEAVRIAPDHTNALTGLINIHTQVRQFDRATAYLREFERRTDSDIAPLILRADLLAYQGRIADAARIYHQVLQIDPQLPHPLRNLAICYEELGRWDDARKTYERLAELDPYDTQAREMAETVGKRR